MKFLVRLYDLSYIPGPDADMKVLALSDRKVNGNPRRQLQMNCSFGCAVNKPMSTLPEPFSSEDFPSRMYNGPMKSNPEWANDGSRDTRSISSGW